MKVDLENGRINNMLRIYIEIRDYETGECKDNFFINTKYWKDEVISCQAYYPRVEVNENQAAIICYE